MLRPPAPLPSRHPSHPRCGGRWRRGRSLCRRHMCSAGWSECGRAPGAPFCETAPRLEPKPSAPPCRAPCSFYQERGDFLFPLFVENIPSAESGRAAVLRTRAAVKAPVARKPPRAAPALPALPGLGEPTASSHPELRWGCSEHHPAHGLRCTGAGGARCDQQNPSFPPAGIVFRKI